MKADCEEDAAGGGVVLGAEAGDGVDCFGDATDAVGAGADSVNCDFCDASGAFAGSDFGWLAGGSSPVSTSAIGCSTMTLSPDLTSHLRRYPASFEGTVTSTYNGICD